MATPSLSVVALAIWSLLVSSSDGSGYVIAKDAMAIQSLGGDGVGASQWVHWEEAPHSGVAAALEPTVRALLERDLAARAGDENDSRLELTGLSLRADGCDWLLAARDGLRTDPARRVLLLDGLPSPHLVLTANYTLHQRDGSQSGLMTIMSAEASGTALLKHGDDGVDGVGDVFLRYSVLQGLLVVDGLGGIVLSRSVKERLSDVLGPEFDGVFKELLQEAVEKPEELLQVAVDKRLAPGNLNGVVDVALSYFRKWVLRNGYDSSPLPDVDESIKHGYFKASGGSFQHLSTLQRVSDVVVTGPDTNATIVGDFSLSDLNFDFAKYRARYFFVRIKGKVKGWAKVNRVRVGVRLFVGPPGVCSITLQSLKVVQLDGISLRLTGPFPHQLSKLATKAVNRSKGKLIAMAEQHGAEKLRAAFAELDCPRTVCRFLRAAGRRPRNNSCHM